ncbi:MAG: hypothetical protein RLZZ419_2120, partial [Pseudomonadota bacterium]
MVASAQSSNLSATNKAVAKSSLYPQASSSLPSACREEAPNVAELLLMVWPSRL